MSANAVVEIASVRPQPDAPDTSSHRQGSRETAWFDVEHAPTGFRVSCSLTLSKAGGTTMRHRHVFSQLRYIMDGALYFSDRRFPAGTLIYTPESVNYGPQSRREDVRLLVFQFPGPSDLMPLAARQLPPEKFAEGLAGLKAAGVRIEDGVAVFPDGRKDEPANAVYAFMAGRKLAYAPARYLDPVTMQTGNFPWLPTAHAGVSARHLAYFNECGPSLAMLKLDPGAALPAGRAACLEIRMVLKGAVECGGERHAAVSRIYMPPGADYERLESSEGAELLVFQIAVPGGEAPPPRVII